MRLLLSCIIAMLSLFSSLNPAHAQDGWKFEFVPYAWLAGVDADVTVGDRTVKADVGFEDLFDAFDIGGSFLAVTQYNRWVLWTQVDYFALDTDELDDAPEKARLETDSLFATAAFGYQFRTFGEHSTIDVLGGARYLDIENEITVSDVGSGGGSRDYVDGIFMIRPSFQLTSWMKFNPTLSVGAGDSELTYELQPQVQFQLTDHVVARVGYRRLYYDIKNGDREFDGSFHGAIAGVGVVF